MNKKSYNAIAQEWDAARTKLHGRERALFDTFLTGLETPSHILDLGCGTGRPIAEYLLNQGHTLTGVDQAENLLDIARKRYPQARWIESTIEDFDNSERYAGIVCWDALFHIERGLHESLLGKMARLLQPRGRLALTVGGSAHPAFTDTMFGQPFFYDSYPPEEFEALLKQQGFTLVAAEFLNLPTSGRDKGRYAIIAVAA